MDQETQEAFIAVNKRLSRLEGRFKYTRPMQKAGVELCLQSGASFKQKTLSLTSSIYTVYIPLSKKKLDEIKHAFPGIAEEG